MRAEAAARGAGLGFWTASALVVGNILGSGVFALPASLAPYGAASLLGWAVSIAGAMFTAVVFAHLATRHPRTGGPYTYAHLAFGDRVGFLVAWCYWVSIWCANAAIAIAFAGSLGALWPSVAQGPAGAGCALAALWICTGFNVAGVRTAGGVQALTTVLKILPLVAVVGFGVWHVDFSNFRPFNPSGLGLFETTGITTALTLWALQGLECATVPADEVRDAARTVPRATVFGTALAAVVTVLVCTVVLGLAPPGALKDSAAPIADVARRLWGNGAAQALAAAMAVSCFGALNGWVLMQGQIPLAAARDGLFPAFFARLDANGTPRVGLVAGSVLATVLVVANYSGSLVTLFTWSVLLATTAALVPYCAGAAAALKLDGGVRGGMAVVAVLALVYSVWAMIGTTGEARWWGLGLLVAGSVLYVLRKRGA